MLNGDQQNSDQNGDNCNHDQQLDQRESAPAEVNSGVHVMVRIQAQGRYANKNITSQILTDQNWVSIMPKTPRWTEEWTVGVRVWMAREGRSLLGEGRADLLTSIDRLHSITKAAKE